MERLKEEVYGKEVWKLIFYVILSYSIAFLFLVFLLYAWPENIQYSAASLILRALIDANGIITGFWAIAFALVFRALPRVASFWYDRTYDLRKELSELLEKGKKGEAEEKKREVIYLEKSINIVLNAVSKRILGMLVVSVSSFILSILTSLYPLATSSYQVSKVDIIWPIFFLLSGMVLLLPVFYEVREMFLVPESRKIRGNIYRAKTL